VIGKDKVHLVHKAQTGSRDIALLHLNFGARWGWVVNAMTQLHYPWKRDPGPIAQEAGWALGLAWMGKEKFAPHQALNLGPSSL